MRHLCIRILVRISSLLLKGILWWLPHIIQSLGVCIMDSFWRKPNSQLHPRTHSIYSNSSCGCIHSDKSWSGLPHQWCGCQIFSFFFRTSLTCQCRQQAQTHKHPEAKKPWQGQLRYKHFTSVARTEISQTMAKITNRWLCYRVSCETLCRTHRTKELAGLFRVIADLTKAKQVGQTDSKR